MPLSNMNITFIRETGITKWLIRKSIREFSKRFLKRDNILRLQHGGFCLRSSIHTPQPTRRCCSSYREGLRPDSCSCQQLITWTRASVHETRPTPKRLPTRRYISNCPSASTRSLIAGTTSPFPTNLSSDPRALPSSKVGASPVFGRRFLDAPAAHELAANDLASEKLRW
jgi:hypothetical protein